MTWGKTIALLVLFAAVVHCGGDEELGGGGAEEVPSKPDAASVSDGASSTPDGASSTACASDQLQCGGVCTTVQSDRANCGGCNVACSDGDVCSSGKCRRRDPCDDLLEVGGTLTNGNTFQTLYEYNDDGSLKSEDGRPISYEQGGRVISDESATNRVGARYFLDELGRQVRIVQTFGDGFRAEDDFTHDANGFVLSVTRRGFDAAGAPVPADGRVTTNENTAEAGNLVRRASTLRPGNGSPPTTHVLVQEFDTRLETRPNLYGSQDRSANLLVRQIIDGTPMTGFSYVVDSRGRVQEETTSMLNEPNVSVGRKTYRYRCQ